MMGLVAMLFATGAAAQEMRIQFAEKVAIAAAPGHTEFDAYGRRFSLDLESNDRLVRSLVSTGKLSIGKDRLLRGRVNGVAGSWVRFAKVGDGIEGAIWDGQDLYVVTSKRQIASKLTLAIDGQDSQTVVYRLSDIIGGLPKDFCGVDVGLPASKVTARSGLDQYKEMVAELRVNAAALAVNEQLDISLIADTAFQNQKGPLAQDSMIARLSIVDGIFSEQVGVIVVPTELRMIPAGSDPFTTNDPDALVEQLADYRNATPAVKAAGLAHLMTGRDLDGNIIGIAFRDVLCEPREGVSLSDSEFDDFISGLIMAHELGHNFGAPHDGVAGSACSSVPQNFLMAPALNNSSTFSQCSLNQMQTAITRARGVCIHSAQYADLAVQLPGTQIVVDSMAEFSLPVTINSVGTASAIDGSLRVDLPSQITFQSAVVAGGSCSASGNLVTCQLGDIPGGEQRSVDLRLISTVLGTYQVSAAVAADNDYLLANNSGTVSVGLQSAVDLGVAMTVSSANVFVTDTLDFTIDVTSTRSQAAHGGVLNVGFGGAIETINAGAHACAADASITGLMHCDLADIASNNTTSRITVRVRAVSPGPVIASASVYIANDGDYTNNNAQAPYTAHREREVITTVSTEQLLAVIGQSYDLVFTMRSVGRQPATDVTTVIYGQDGDIVSFTPSAGNCQQPPGLAYTCNFGTLNPGDTRTVTVRVRFDTPRQAWISAYTDYPDGAGRGGNWAQTLVYANVRVDVDTLMYAPSSVIEGQTGRTTFQVSSLGIDLAQNVVATVDVPAPLRLTAVNPTYNPHGFVCALLTQQRLQCTGSFSAAAGVFPQLRVEYDFVSDVAATGNLQLNVTASGDGDPANNSLQRPFQVTPYLDVALTTNLTRLVFIEGEVKPFDFTLSTGRNPVAGVYIFARGLPPWFVVDSMSFNNTDCPRAPWGSTNEFYCLVGDLPANSSYPVVLRFRAMQAGIGGGIAIEASAPGDANSGNGWPNVGFDILRNTDVSVSVAQATMSATTGSVFHLPLVTVTNTGSMASDTVVEIPVPPFTTVSSVSSAGGTCTGTTTLQCSFWSLSDGMRPTIDVSLLASTTGTFTSNITVRSANDSNAGNNGTSVALTVTSPTSGNGGGSSSSGGGKKGGGSLEWLALAFLGLLALQRVRSVRQQIRIAHERHVRAVR
jgi:hypothetical protein